MEGADPLHSPFTPPCVSTDLVAAIMVLSGFPLDCILVFMRSRGFVTPAATAPLRDPAAILRPSELLSAVTPIASLTGP